jgi:PHD/YefM family antitoxin component YafN of YafNO toxin-antitoxin module
MIYYTKDEIQSSTTVSRNFGGFLDNLKDNKLEKIAVMRNNKLEAVIISLEEYEILKEYQELKEHIEIFEIVKKRKKNKKTHNFEDILKENGIDYNEL